jgi:hypothetical protein
MADLVITAANVAAGAGATIDRTHNAGATITAGQVVALDTDNTYKPADNNSGTAALRVAAGIALNAASSGQPVGVLTAGPITIGAAVSANVGYYLSANAGGVCPIADLSAGMYPSFLGFATSTTVLNVNIQAAGGSL